MPDPKTPDAKLEAVIHLNTVDQEEWRQVLTQIDHLLAEDDSVRVEVVCQGRAVDLVRRPTTHYSLELTHLAKRGVSFVACQQSLRARAIPEAELLPFVTIVPTAIGELVRAQYDGKAYLKPF